LQKIRKDVTDPFYHEKVFTFLLVCSENVNQISFLFLVVITSTDLVEHVWGLLGR